MLILPYEVICIHRVGNDPEQTDVLHRVQGGKHPGGVVTL
jgi:hypothetical protein